MVENFSSWVGRGVTRTDLVTPRLVGEYRATLEPFLFRPEDERVCPPGIHWGLAPALPAMTELGEDGSEAKGLFLPPVSLPRRMWAGGQVECVGDICLGMEIARRSTISDIRMREGKSGPLCFISLTHEIRSANTLLLRERQDLVFRGGGHAPQPTSTPHEAASGDVEWTVEPTAAMLFRFSAFMFNAHRVHYDVPYAVEGDGYGGLLVHGPLQAALLLNQASRMLGRVAAGMDYRCLAPLVAGSPMAVRTRRNATGAEGRIVDHQGTLTTEAAVTA